MRQILKIIVFLCILNLLACDSKSMNENSNDQENSIPNLAENTIDRRLGHVVYHSQGVSDQNIILDICDLCSIDSDSIVLVQVASLGEVHTQDPCVENIKNYHIPYREVVLEVIQNVAGEELEGQIYVRKLNSNSGEIYEASKLLAHVRKLDDINYMTHYYLAYFEEEAPAPNPSTTIDVPKDFEEFSRLMKLTYDQNNPDCPPPTHFPDEEWRKVLGLITDSCAPEILDE